MGPGTVHSLHLADYSFLEIESALAPAENFSDRGSSFERAKHSISDGAAPPADPAVAAAGLKGESAAALPEAAHLQNLGSRKLIEIADERMAGIDSFGRDSTLGQRTDKTVQMPAQAALAHVRRHSHDFLLVSDVNEFFVVRPGSEANDVQRREMLPGVGGLLERDSGL